MKIAIASGKGGTGKTTVAVNLYHTIAKYYDEKVRLVDCDVEEPNDALFFPGVSKTDESPVNLRVPEIDTEKCSFCRKCIEYCEFNAITVIPPLKHAEISADLCHSCGACLHACKFDAIREYPYEIGKLSSYKLPVGQGLTEGRLKVGSALQTPVINELKKKTNVQGSIIIYDAPPGTSCPLVATVSDVDFVILVAEPTPFGLHDLKLAVKLMREINKYFGVVINKYGLGDNKLEDYLAEEGIKVLEKIPFNRIIAREYSGNKLLVESVPGYEQHYINIINNTLKKWLS